MPMSLTDTEKTDVRRFCGYPAYGAGAAGFQNWRFYQAYGLLEFRINNLADAELTAIMGTRPAMRDFVLLWRSVHEVHPLDLSDAVIEGCAASTAGKAPLATADCVLAAAALPS